MKYVTIPISSEEKDKIMDFYQENKIENPNDYVLFAAKSYETQILIYTSKKGYKVLYQGEEPLKEATILFPMAKENVPKKKKEKTVFIDYSDQIGSDEVGTGDLFGPLIVTACSFCQKNKDLFSNYHIDDSKKISDDYILKIIPEIAENFILSQYTLMPIQYNDLIQKGWSMNKIKAYLHNKALLSLSKKVNYAHAYIDQFCSKEKYFSYLNTEKNIFMPIIFSTQGESHFPSVAVASMVARYSFLKAMEKMENAYKFKFPKGSGKAADEALLRFLELFGKDELKYVLKTNFSNVKNLSSF